MFAFVLADDSMAPWFNNGECVTVDPRQPIRPGDYVVAVIAGVPLFRRLHLVGLDDDNSPILQLRPVNASWPTLPVGPDCLILGKAVEHTRRL